MPEKTDIPKGIKRAFKHIVAGHGNYASSEQAKGVIQYTAQRLESILESVRNALANAQNGNMFPLFTGKRADELEYTLRAR